jgi:predicted Zn-dependent protease
MLLQLVQNPQGSIEQIARRGMADSGFRQIEGGRTSINGLDAYVGTYQGAVEGLGNAATTAAHIVHDRSVYVFAGLAPPNEFEGVRQAFASSIRSFRALTPSEAANIRPNRVDVQTVRGGDTWPSIAARGGGAVKPETLAIMNNSDPSRPPRPGDRVKVVVAG